MVKCSQGREVDVFAKTHKKGTGRTFTAHFVRDYLLAYRASPYLHRRGEEGTYGGTSVT